MHRNSACRHVFRQLPVSRKNKCNKIWGLHAREDCAVSLVMESYTDTPSLAQQLRSEGSGQVTQVVSYIRWIHTRRSNWNSNSYSLEPDRTQHDRLTVCVSAQQYDFASLIFLYFHSRREKFVALLRNAITTFFFNFFFNFVSETALNRASICCL